MDSLNVSRGFAPHLLCVTVEELVKFSLWCTDSNRHESMASRAKGSYFLARTAKHERR
jgi:hypothetical protein